MNKFTKAQIIFAGIVAAGVFCIFLPALQNGFTNWDDNIYITENHHIRPFGFGAVIWAFTQFYSSNWHPLTWISHSIDIAMWGLNPFGHHLSSNLFHAFYTFIVIILLIRLMRRVECRPPMLRDERAVPIAALVAGILFGIHPLHVESVAWVSERKDLLCAFFYLMSLFAYAGYAEADRNTTVSFGKYSSRSYLLALAFFLMALMSKPMAVSLPVVLLILDWYPFGRIRTLATLKSSLVEKIPYLFLSLASALITILAQRSADAVISLEQLSLVNRLFVSIKVMVLYLGKMLLPTHLTPFYPYPKSLSLLYVLPIFLVIGATLVAIRYARINRLWLAVWSMYVILLLPVLGIIQVSGQEMADRYTYLPSIGPFFLVGLGASWLYSKCRESSHPVRRPLTALCVGMGFVLIITLSIKTIGQIGIWKDSITLWTHAIGLDPDNAEAYNNRGLHYGKVGEFDKALNDFLKAVHYAPQDFRYHYNLGVTYERLGLFAEAINEYSAAININPALADAVGNRAQLFLKVGDMRSALRDFQRSCALGTLISCQWFQELQSAQAGWVR